jgi:hypothetical protein
MSQEDATQDTTDEPAAGNATSQATDEKFDREYVQKLRQENAAARKRAQEAETRAKEFEDRDKSELEKAAEAAKTATVRAEEAEARLLRFEAAAAAGLDSKHAHRLQGSTKEELEADAKELVEQLGGTQQRTTFDGGTRDQPPASAGGMDGLIRQQAGRP